MMKAAAIDAMFRQRVIASILCRTPDNPITGSALAADYGVHLRVITQVIEEARSAGLKIAGSEGGFDRYLDRVIAAGYFQARTPEEMRSTYDRYVEKARKLFTRARTLMDFNRENPTIFEQDIF